MHFWLTTHYPHYATDEAEWWIYVRRGFEHLIQEFDAGDRVAFYEVQKGPDRQGKPKRPLGDGGIRCLATATARPQPTTFQELYVDGPAADFVLEGRCHEHDFGHVLSRDKMFAALKREPKPNLRSLGGGAGFIQLSAEEFSRLESAFIASPRN